MFDSEGVKAYILGFADATSDTGL